MTKSKKANPPPSKFASGLRRLLDTQKNHFTHAAWAEVLGITPAAVSQWLSDKTIPSAEYLRDILSIVENDNSVKSKKAIHDFRKIANRPASEVSPLGERFGESISHYLSLPLKKQLMHDLNRLTPEEQERLLLSFSEVCMRQAGLPPVSDYLGANVASGRRSLPVRAQSRLEVDLSRFSHAELASAKDQLLAMSLPLAELCQLVSAQAAEVHGEIEQQDIEDLCLAAFAAASRNNNKTPAMLYRTLLMAAAIDPCCVTLPMLTELMNALCVLSPRCELWIYDPGGDNACEQYKAPVDVPLEKKLDNVNSREVRYAFS